MCLPRFVSLYVEEEEDGAEDILGQASSPT